MSTRILLMSADHRHSRVRRLGTGTVLVLTGVLLAACGGGGSSPSTASAPSTVPTQSSAPSSVPTSSAPVSSAPVSGGSGSGGSFCQYAKVQKAQEAAEIKAYSTDTPQQLEKFEEQALAEAKVFASTAPSQIKAAVDTVVSEDDAVFNALKAAHFDYTKLPTSFLTTLEAPKFTKADNQIISYLTNTCGINTSAAPAG
jgi:hypothetical protein